ncbi:MAG: 30S ribosome-binding factor RbfA [Alphaproteobacteria bacterium]|nr:30S ribosome-binding factor RbfA [Alphaproteobacteria bacterium]
MGRSKNKEPSQRQLRVGEEVRHALSAIFERGNFRDPILINTIITVTEVRVTPDLRCGRVFIVPLGGKNTEEVLKSLTRCKSYLRKEIGKRLQLRSIPNLIFESDKSFEATGYIDKLLSCPNVARDLENKINHSETSDSEDNNGT